MIGPKVFGSAAANHSLIKFYVLHINANDPITVIGERGRSWHVGIVAYSTKSGKERKNSTEKHCVLFVFAGRYRDKPGDGVKLELL